jgi:putative nucleotidyltransferase with HDIG domain
VSRPPVDALETLGADAWLVGGAVRDRIRGIDSGDLDVVLDGERVEQAARALGRGAGGHVFQLSEGFGVWRVVAHDHSWQVDLTPLAGETIEDDLSQRDFTINAIAEPVAGGPPVDPFGGLHDLATETIRMVAPDAFARDPLRVMRLARIGCELNFEVDDSTLSAAQASAAKLIAVASERVFGELKRIIAADGVLAGLGLMESTGATLAVLPEIAGLRGIEQSRFHHLDVHDHTRAVLAGVTELERGPREVLGEHADAVRELLAEPFANELTRGHALRLGALFHDAAKPQTRAVSEEGRVTFMGHDVAGAELAAAALRRLRASERLIEHVAALVRHHLVLGFLVHRMPLDRREVYRYLTRCRPVPVDVTLLSIADRLATRGDTAEGAIALHLELARQLLGEALMWTEEPPRPPIRGDELTRELGGVRGPEIGRLLAALEEASFAGEIHDRAEALAFARDLHERDGG